MNDIEDGLFHLDVESQAVQDLIHELVRRKIAVTSTLPVFETFVPYRAQVEPRVLDAMEASSRADYLDLRASVNHNTHNHWADLLAKEMQFERDFVSAGGLLI